MSSTSSKAECILVPDLGFGGPLGEYMDYEVGSLPTPAALAKKLRLLAQNSRVGFEQAGTACQCTIAIQFLGLGG
jgi:hypothetical protein